MEIENHMQSPILRELVNAADVRWSLRDIERGMEEYDEKAAIQNFGHHRYGNSTGLSYWVLWKTVLGCFLEKTLKPLVFF